ncbi:MULTISPECIES: DUF4865 family protein [unclassified Streptomyces]|uniref:DUF4865 family protein n=1 Tax=unclassified Streptomyces TaxID=2593676 RepID=UPI00136CC564|nr:MULTISPECIES: DUF4865 family protein [unclassified Streptomyces]NEA05596.1 DUF4865 family protein [Streptomyces sp. SID10116]MYY87370.1 DUF4865 family protein [Streptomyces sp. SID335]MYZ15452.1 DUF4865 family protein [Streptomyces sp. SID337]NDZ89873.1 DUF4865 family protein [Streptomyces sp. SID10115]NEB47443.1 DUF4865 family protein [Streptomyces sp. SID339]
MHAMQYEITLPADYDMGVIRHRVASKGHLLDEFPGLGFKAYLMRERGVDGSPVNQYAPFYLWNTTEGMNAFLWGPGFQGLCEDFGRPVVEHWTTLAYEEGPASGAVPRVAVRRRQRIPSATPLPGLAAELAAEAERLARREGAVSALTAVDPQRWEAVHFSLRESGAPREVGDVFQVLHVSAPERGESRRGRQW